MKSNRKNIKRMLSVLITLCMLIQVLPMSVFAANDNAARASAGSAWSGIADGDILVKDTITKITNGVTEHEVVANTKNGNDQKIDYMCWVEPSDSVKLVAGYGKDSASSWSLVSTTAQAAAYEANHPGETVVAAINADFFNMATGEPMGALVMEGKVYHEANNRWYFAVLKDGTPVIRNTADLSDCQMAVGGFLPLVQNGEVVASSYAAGSDDYSRCTIGIMADGSIVTSVTHGRLAPVSCGRTYKEIAEMYQRAGCVDALVLDGGGSATYAARIEGSDKLEVRNSPSDGAEREVSSSILIVSTAVATGVFDHAAITPNNELYTPGYEVQFEANGVDTAGFPVALPSGLEWALADDSLSMGKIDAATGLFTAGNKTGVVNVELRQNGIKVGSTSIEITVPDHIYFNSEEVSLGFEEETTLGIVVRNADRDINYKAGDLIWSCPVEKLGKFDGNTFIANEEESLNGTVTVTSAYDTNVSGSIHVIVGMLPTVVWDFEDVVDEETGDTISASEYYTGDSGILSTSNYGRGGKQSIEIVGIDDDEPVRFGSHSLKLNFDFTDCGAVTEGACIGTTDSMSIPGSPTGIGVWVYAPEGVGVTYDGTVSGLWLRGYVKDGNGNNMPYDFTLEPKNTKVQAGYNPETGVYTVQPGIYWDGWMYLEADLTTMTGPFGVQPGMTFRLVYVAGTGMIGNKLPGSIYFDNLQFVYGTNVDDTDNPVIDSIRVNDTPLENGAVLTTDTLNVNAYLHDVENKYTTGIDTSTVRMYVDGVNVVGNDKYQYVLEPDGSIAHLYDTKLIDGQHSITVSLRDGFGNETSETKWFEVKTGNSADAAMSVVPRENTAILGKTVNLDIKASNSNIKSSTTQLKINNRFKDYTVSFSDNYEGSYTYSKLSDILTITAERKADAAADDNGVIATVTVNVPTTLNESANFSYTVKSGSYITNSDFYATYSAPEATLSVGAAYVITAEPMIVGTNGIISVTDEVGKPAAGVGLYLAETDEQVGITDENGEWETDYFGKESGTIIIYAKDEQGLLSFRYRVSSYNDIGNDDGLPYGILFNATDDITSKKSISWFTANAAGKQSISYTISGKNEWTTVSADSKLRTFTKGGNSVVMVNSAILTGLESGTTYEYRVGGGELWSEVDTFTTASSGQKDVNFFVLGDIQAEDTTHISSIMDILKAGNYQFGIQTGDAVDDATSYYDWMDVAGLFGTENMGNVDMIHVLGNHEFAGDAKGSTASAVYNLPVEKAGGYYSVTYGDVYMAVINYTGTGAQLKEALEWLVKDAKSSNATWKVLCMHQPAYYTNASGGNGEIYNTVPDAVEEAGINVVFSGHDHTLARTNQIRDDQIDEDNGIVYYIAGSSGEKSYSITSQDIFDYNTIFKVATQDFTATYLTASADSESMTINMCDLDKGIMDTITLYTPCVRNGHDYHYDTDKKSVVCTVCGDEDADYSGEITDVNGNKYYLIAGKLQTGWVTIGEETCYFAPKTGIKEKVTRTVDIPSTCTTTGYYILTSESGATKRNKYTAAPGHNYELNADGKYECTECGRIRIELSECDISLPHSYYTYTGKAINPYPTVVDPTGRVLEGHQVDFFVSYWANNVDVGEASVLIRAKNGYNVNLTDFRGDYGGTVEYTYQIRPDLATNVKAATAGISSVKLTWTAAKAPNSTYEVYVSSDGGKKWIKAGETKGTEFTATGLKSNTEYRFKLRTSAVNNDVSYKSLKYTDPVAASTGKVINLSSCTVTLASTSVSYTGNALKPAVTVRNADGKVLTPGMDYTVAYSNNVNPGTATVTVTGKDNYTGSVKKTFTINSIFTSVSLNKTSITIGVGETYKLTATASPLGKTAVYSWSSSKSGVVTVNGGAAATSLGDTTIKGVKTGTATVTVKTQDGKSATCVITVKPAPTSIKLNKTAITLGVGETFDLNSTVNSGSASYVRYWSTSNSSVATAPGSIINAKKVGTATITVKTYNGKTATCIVSVKPAPTKVTLNKTSITLGVGETFDLNSTVNSGSASYVRNYTSSNSSVATAPGSIINAKKVGTATITVKTYNGKTATCKVTVKPAPTSIKLNKTSITLKVGQTYDLNSTVNSGSASYVRNYTSSNSSVATVPGSIINAKKVGTATITVKTYNGKTATCKVTVTK